MPNHITNIISFRGDDDKIREMLEAVKNDELGLGSIDFNKIIPMPDHIFKGNLGQEEREKYGVANWYDWSIQNWGTKWPSYGYDNLSEFQVGNDIYFDTAWSAPPPVLQRLSEQYPQIEIAHRWADEDFGFNCGEREYRAGEILSEFLPEGGSKEAYELAADVMDITIEDAGLKLNADGSNYEYEEEGQQLT